MDGPPSSVLLVMDGFLELGIGIGLSGCQWWSVSWWDGLQAIGTEVHRGAWCLGSCLGVLK
jgi:hypothetical protein